MTILYSLALALALASCAVTPDPGHWQQCPNGAFCPIDTTCSDDGTECKSLELTGDGSVEVTKSLCACELSGDDECEPRTMDVAALDSRGPTCPKGDPPSP